MLISIREHLKTFGIPQLEDPKMLDYKFWNEIKEELSTIKGEDLSLSDSGSYTRGQQAIDYVDRVKNYYQLLSAHSCVAPKDQLTFF